MSYSGLVPKKIKPVTFNQHLGSVVNGVLTNKGWTQDDLIAGTQLNKTTVGRRIRGSHPMLVSELVIISSYLGVPAGKIVSEALEQFGGIDKLLSEAAAKNEVEEKAAPDNVTPMGKHPRDQTDEELHDGRMPHAADPLDRDATKPDDEDT